MSQAGIISAADQIDVVNSITATAPLTANGVSGVAETGAVTLAISGSGFVWSSKATSFSAAADNGYFITAAATATLPTAPTTGTTIIFVVTASSGSILIRAGTGDTIAIGNAVSATAGAATVTTQSGTTINGSTLNLVYNNALATWYAIGGTIGFWSVA